LVCPAFARWRDIEDERKAMDDGWTIFLVGVLVGALITFELALMIATGKPYPSLYFFLSALAGH
jgi:surfactin synthase thioesterase subunit